MKIKRLPSEKGQYLVILALMMLGIVALLAVALDGGNLYLKRRAAQNAADAGALAGARELCLNHDPIMADFMARQYAIVHNGASQAYPEIASDVITVTTIITTPTFFAHFIGFPTVAATADAAAGCFPATIGEGVLPVAWACRPSITGGGVTECQEKTISEDTLENYLNNIPPLSPGEIRDELYIVMDSGAEPDDLAAICTSQGGWLNCDVDGDGDDDLIANGDRSWLDLNGGGGGSSELIGWINGGYPGKIQEHTWLGGQSGVANNVFQAVDDHVGEIVILPVFSAICDDYPDPRCSSEVHGRDIIRTSAGGSYYYHVITFAAFYISCVDAPGTHNPGGCPGKKAAIDAGIIDQNTKTIEGYFVEGIFPELGGGSSGGGLVTGAYSLKLIR